MRDRQDISAPLVHGIGWFEGRFGYNIHTRNFFGALSQRLPVTVSPLVVFEGPLEPDLEILSRVWGDRRVTVTLLYGSHVDIAGAVEGSRIGYTVWETTRLPDDWFGPLSAMDRIWVPTEWGRRVMLENGFAADRVDVVPEGIDPSIFRTDAAPAPYVADLSGFKFLSVGRWERRKGTEEIIRAFDIAFGPEHDVRLLLSCDNHHDPDFEIGSALRALELRYPHRIVYIPPVRSHDTLARLYTGCDAYVGAARAEGWGLPLLEAMASGLPVIAPFYSGPTAFLGPEAYVVAHREVPVDVPYFDREDADYGVWAEPDVEDLARQMRAVYADQSAARARGSAGATRAREQFTWANAADVADGLIRALQEDR